MIVPVFHNTENETQLSLTELSLRYWGDAPKQCKERIRTLFPKWVIDNRVPLQQECLDFFRFIVESYPQRVEQILTTDFLEMDEELLNLTQDYSFKYCQKTGRHPVAV